MNVLHRLWNSWKRFGRWMGDQVARIVFTAFYFTVAMPFGVGVRLGTDVLGRSSAPAWLPKVNPEDSLEASRRLF